jgi:hypothetical protein
MSKTVKIILIVAVLGIMILICLCLLLGGVITLSTYFQTSTPTTAPVVIVPTVIVPTTAVPPTAVPPTVAPTAAATATPAATAVPATPTPLSPDAGFVLDGVNLKVMDVRYMLINGGESGVNYLSRDDGFLYVITLDSNTKDLGFVYDNYVKTIRLVDTVSGDFFETDWMYWSDDDSQSNSGYVKLSFPVKKVLEKPAIYFNDETGVDLTPILPKTSEVEDPWLDIKKKFDVYGNDLKVQSVILTLNYTSPDEHKFVIEQSGNKVLVVKFVSSHGDLSGVQDWDPIIIDPDNPQNQYYYGYESWTNDSSRSQGSIEYSYEVPGDMARFILYVPFENLIDLTSVVKKK